MDGTQQQITAFLGERTRKPRQRPSDALLPPSKRRRVDDGPLKGAKGAPAPTALAAPVASVVSEVPQVVHKLSPAPKPLALAKLRCVPPSAKKPPPIPKPNSGAKSGVAAKSGIAAKSGVAVKSGIAAKSGTEAQHGIVVQSGLTTRPDVTPEAPSASSGQLNHPPSIPTLPASTPSDKEQVPEPSKTNFCLDTTDLPETSLLSEPSINADLSSEPDTPPVAFAIPEPAPLSAHDKVQEQKKKWRIAELSKKEREAKRMRPAGQPAFVFDPPKFRIPINPSSKRVTGDPVPSDKSEAASSAAAYRAKSAYLSGGEALLFDKDRLPKSHARLLDVLAAMESAASLLQIRKVPTTMGRIREIVERATKRDFTLRIFSQLAHVIPECVAVLPAAANGVRSKRASDDLILRLDHPDLSSTALGVFRAGSSVLGESVSRMRRSLLHRRLIEDVRKRHDEFVATANEKSDGETWHPDFDVDSVPPLPAPPIDAFRRSKPHPKPSPLLSSFTEVEAKGPVSNDTNDDDDEDVCIPKNLLSRVRAREKAKEEQVARAVDDKTSERTILQKLPSTMDTINTLFRAEKRSAMGWALLVSKVRNLHPRKWSKQDLEEQLDTITKLAPEWCAKVELKSSRGGFAFRVVSEKQFAKSRGTVCSTETLTQ